MDIEMVVRGGRFSDFATLEDMWQPDARFHEMSPAEAWTIMGNMEGDEDVEGIVVVELNGEVVAAGIAGAAPETWDVEFPPGMDEHGFVYVFGVVREHRGDEDFMREASNFVAAYARTQQWGPIGGPDDDS